MKMSKSGICMCALLSLGLVSNSDAQGKRGRPGKRPGHDGPGAQAGVYTTVSGSVVQFNYGRDAEVEGFLLGSGAIIHLPPQAAVRMERAIRKGDNVQVAGLAQTSVAGVQSIKAQSVQDKTSGKSIRIPQPGAAAPFSGSGRIQQLNHGPDGAVNGFLIESGTLALVPPFAAKNASSVRVGAAVAYSGYARNTVSGRTVVDVTTLTINRQHLSMERGRDPLAAPPLSGPPTPDSRTAEPPPPPAPVAPPAR